MNSIIAFNTINGVWSDDVSLIKLEYNCFYGNTDGNLSECNPEFGILLKINKNKDSIDFADNIFKDPIFAGSCSDSSAVENDLSLATDKSRIKDTLLAKILHDTLNDAGAANAMNKFYKNYSLSPYSPCVNAGNPGKKFNDANSTRNDMGMYGGVNTNEESKKK
jgi:hypothetical protein